MVSTDTSLSAEKIMTLYSYRFKIESTFRAFKQTFAGFSYHFWTKSLEKLNRYARKTDASPLEKLPSKTEQKAVIQTFHAIEGFVQFAFIAQGLVQLLALMFSVEFLGILWLRTLRKDVPSENTVIYCLQRSILWQFQKRRPIHILHLIQGIQPAVMKEFDG